MSSLTFAVTKKHFKLKSCPLMSSKPKALLLVNPFSGNKRGVRVANMIAPRLKPLYDIHQHISQAPGEVTQTIRNLKHEMDAVFVVGGDGTVNEVLQEIVNTHLTLGVFPLGSGNATAYELGILTMNQGLKRILNGKIKTYDCGLMNERYFMNIAGLGFDTVIALGAEKQKLRGPAAYVRLVLKHYLSYKPLRLSFKVEHKKWHCKIFMVNIANMRQLGNFAFTAPMAKPDDGLLDLCILKPFPKAFSSDILLRLFSASLHNSRYYEHMSVDRLKIEGDFKYANVDGESIKVDGSMEIKVVPKSVKIFS